MKKKFINYSIKLIESKKDLSNLDKKKLKYGLEGFYNLITKVVVLIILALILNLTKELFLLIIIYSLFRLYGFGIHAKKTWQCWITTIPIYIGGCFFIKYISIPLPITYIIWFFGFISFLLFAPADTSSRPLIHKDKRIRAKILSLLIIIIFYIINYFYKSQILLNTTLYALIFESIVINPLTYKLFKAPYNNYKVYQKTTV